MPNRVTDAEAREIRERVEAAVKRLGGGTPTGPIRVEACADCDDDDVGVSFNLPSLDRMLPHANVSEFDLERLAEPLRELFACAPADLSRLLEEREALRGLLLRCAGTVKMQVNGFRDPDAQKLLRDIGDVLKDQP